MKRTHGQTPCELVVLTGKTSLICYKTVKVYEVC
jgi:hypothetical protein